jgi:hypothetical protein
LVLGVGFPRTKSTWITAVDPPKQSDARGDYDDDADQDLHVSSARLIPLSVLSRISLGNVVTAERRAR